MNRIKYSLQISVLAVSMFSHFPGALQAQVDLKDYQKHESKIFAKNQLNVIQSQFTDANGFVSHIVFLRKNGLSPQNEKSQSVPFFSVSYQKTDVIEKDGKFRPVKSAKPVSIDFFVKTISTWNSANVATPIWDGRVYQDNYELVVGGYSSKFSERPIGKIDDKGRFVSQLQGEFVKEFPILQLPAEQIIFDPFEWKLLRIEPANGKAVQKSTNHFLPIDILSQNGELLNDLSFETETSNSNASLQLFAFRDGKKVEIATCNPNESASPNTREGFRPGLIEGCSQQGNGNIVTFTLEGSFSRNVVLKNAELYLANDAKYEAGKIAVKPNKIDIDGDFQDWRNIKGVSDFEGDYVTYLFKNPDTDLLDIKVTNDDKYLYLYSRVAGAHGRTGAGGRYYWYSYIDVDRNENTGYIPTRDDNCYFGTAIGDDCEAQFEFIGDKFIKTFFGFTGAGAEKEALSGVVELGPSFYSAKGMDGKPRDRYKVEYVNRKGSRFITHDVTEGTSEDIIIAMSPDGSEVEVKVELAGFLKDKSGTDLMYRGKKVNIAIGVEGASGYYGSDAWGADSSPVIYDYLIK